MPTSASPAINAIIRSSSSSIAQHRRQRILGRFAAATTSSHVQYYRRSPSPVAARAFYNAARQQEATATAAAAATAAASPAETPVAASNVVDGGATVSAPGGVEQQPIVPLAPASETAAGTMLRPDPELALSRLNLGQLAAGWLVYQACGNTRLVQAAPSILKLFEKLRLSWLSNAVLRRTFFAWFCAGEHEREIVQTMRRLQDAGIGSILDFSAEADLAEDSAASSSSSSAAEAARAMANVKADALTKEYGHGVEMANQVAGSFAAVKVTGLADPEVLYRLSQAYRPLRRAFAAADHDRDGKVDFTQFRDQVLPVLPGGGRVASASGVFAMVDGNGDGQVDWVDVQMALGMDNPMARPLFLRATPTSEYGAAESDVEDYERMISRARAVVQQGSDNGVRVMVDAEHTYFQPMIDHVALVMQREFNTSRPVVFNTYQMYRADSLQRMAADYERAAREGWRFAAKLVRGAYMELERARAEAMGYDSPINPTLEATHACYDEGVRLLMEHIAAAQKAGATPPALFVATHNNNSVERALRLHQELGIDGANEPVMFGQLMGMQDATSYALAAAQQPIYKYVPYGPLTEVMPYLIRRAQENSAVAESIRQESSSAMAEIRRRLFGGRASRQHR